MALLMLRHSQRHKNLTSLTYPIHFAALVGLDTSLFFGFPYLLNFLV